MNVTVGGQHRVDVGFSQHDNRPGSLFQGVLSSAPSQMVRGKRYSLGEGSGEGRKGDEDAAAGRAAAGGGEAGLPARSHPGSAAKPQEPRPTLHSLFSGIFGGRCGGGRGSRVSLVQYTQWGVPNTKRQGCSFEMGSTHCTNLSPAPQSPTDSHLLKVACYLLISMLILSKEPYPMVLARSSQSISLASSTLISYNL